MSTKNSYHWQKQPEREEALIVNQRNHASMPQKQKNLATERREQQEYKMVYCTTKDSTSNITPKKEDVHRFSIVNEFLEQKTAQKKNPPIYLGDASIKQAISIQRAEEEEQLYFENRNENIFENEYKEITSKEKANALSEVSRYKNQREHKGYLNSAMAADFESFGNKRTKGKENNNRSFLKSPKNIHLETSRELFDDCDAEMERLEPYGSYFEERSKEKNLNIDKKYYKELMSQKSRSKLDNMQNANQNVISTTPSVAVRGGSGKSLDKHQLQKMQASNEQPNNQRKVSGSVIPSKKTIMSYPDEEDRSLPQTPRSEGEYQIDYSSIFQHETRRPLIQSEFVEQEEQSYSEDLGEKQELDENEYNQQKRYENSQNSCDEYSDQLENDEDDMQQNFSENRQVVDGDFYESQSNIEDIDDDFYDEQGEDFEDSSPYDLYEERIKTSQGYYQNQNQSAQRIRRQNEKKLQDSKEENIQIVEIKLRGQPTSKQTTLIFPEESQHAETYSMKLEKAQALSSSNTFSKKFKNSIQNDSKDFEVVIPTILQNDSHLSPKAETKSQLHSNCRYKDINVEAQHTKNTRTNKLTNRILEITKARTPSDREENHKLNHTPSNHKKNQFEPERLENSQIYPSVQSSLNQQVAWPQFQQATVLNGFSYPQQTELGQLQQPTNWIQGPNSHAVVYNQTIQTPTGYFPTAEIPNQQVFYSQYNQFPYPQVYQSYLAQGYHQIPSPQFVIPQAVINPYQIATNSNYHTAYSQPYPNQPYPNQPYPAQPYAVYTEDGTDQRWYSQDNSNLQNQFLQATASDALKERYNPHSKNLQERAEDDSDLNKKYQIKNFIEEQESFLRNFEEEKKIKWDKNKKGKFESENHTVGKAKKGVNLHQVEPSQHLKLTNLEGQQSKEIPQKEEVQTMVALQKEQRIEQPIQHCSKIENLVKIPKMKSEREPKNKNVILKHEPKSDTMSPEENIADEFNEESTEIKVPLQRQKNTAPNEQQNEGGSKTPMAKSQKHLPRSEAFEIAWDDQSQNGGGSLAEIFKKRKKNLVERLDNQKLNASKKEKPPEKTKEELFQLRKQMMEYRGAKVFRETGNVEPSHDVYDDQFLLEASVKDFTQQFKPVIFEASDYKRKKSREPKPALIERLAGGIKTKVSKEEMVKLTNRRYEMLPEIQKKKDSDRKKEDLRNRKEKVKELENKIKEAKYRRYNFDQSPLQ